MEKPKKGYFRVAWRHIVGLIVQIVIIFVLAGRLDYWQGWVFCVFFTALIIEQLLLFSHNLNLGLERIKPGPGMKWWDRIFYFFWKGSHAGIIIVGSLDTGRFGWSDESLLPVIVGVIFFLISIAGFHWAMQTNQFFSSVVRIQHDRNHHVITTGPYQYVRHPGYVAAILFTVGSSLLLGSYVSLIPAGIAVFSLIIRTFLEDRTLQKELDGYTDFTKQTPYRLIPYIW